MKLKHANPNGENVVASHLHHMHFFFLKIVKIELKKQASYVIFSIRFLNGLQNKISHIFHLTYENRMNKSFSCRYGSIM
jgi:hypothetical protein